MYYETVLYEPDPEPKPTADPYSVPDMPGPETMDENSVHLPYTMPPVPTGGSKGAGAVTVNTDAIKHYIRFLEQITPAISHALEEMSGVQVRPGAFFQANQLTGKVNGGGQLAESTVQVLTQTLDAIAEVRSSCELIIRKYRTTSELADADAQEFGQLVNTANAMIGSIGSSNKG